MPSYSSYKRQMSVLDKDDDITWITVKGNHIPIKKGQSKEDAVKEFLESKKSGSSKSDKGATSKSAPAKSESKSAGTKTKKEYPYEFETVRKNALANPLTYNHRYTQKSKAAAYKEYQETAGKKSDNGGSFSTSVAKKMAQGESESESEKVEKPKEKSTKSNVHMDDPKKWNDPRTDPWYALYN